MLRRGGFILLRGAFTLSGAGLVLVPTAKLASVAAVKTPPESDGLPVLVRLLVRTSDVVLGSLIGSGNELEMLTSVRCDVSSCKPDTSRDIAADGATGDARPSKSPLPPLRRHVLGMYVVHTMFFTISCKDAMSASTCAKSPSNASVSTAFSSKAVIIRPAKSWSRVNKVLSCSHSYRACWRASTIVALFTLSASK